MLVNETMHSTYVDPTIKQTLEDLSQGATLVHLAVENNDISYINTVDKELILKVDRDLETPLHYAAVNNNLELCKILLNKAPELLNMKCIEGNTALDWVNEYNLEYNNSHIDLVEFLENKM